MNWLITYSGDIIVLSLLTSVVAYVVWRMIIEKKKRKGCGCGGCAGCSNACMCQGLRDTE